MRGTLYAMLVGLGIWFTLAWAIIFMCAAWNALPLGHRLMEIVCTAVSLVFFSLFVLIVMNACAGTPVKQPDSHAAFRDCIAQGRDAYWHNREVTGVRATPGPVLDQIYTMCKQQQQRDAERAVETARAARAAPGISPMQAYGLMLLLQQQQHQPHHSYAPQVAPAPSYTLPHQTHCTSQVVGDFLYTNCN